MGRVLTNNVSLSVTIESALNVAGTTWFQLEPNDISTFGAQITTVARTPISKNRQRRKGAVTDLDSSVEFEHDLTREVALMFFEGFVFASLTGPTSLSSFGNSLVADNDVAGAGVNGFNHTAITAAYANNVLLWSRGWNLSLNNGLFVVDGPNSTTVVTAVQGTPGILDETPGASQITRVDVAGRRAASGDITWTQATKTLGSTVLNFTTLGLTVGQFIHVGGLTATNQFLGGVLYGRVRSIAAGAVVLDKITGTLVADDAGTGKVIDILFGRFLRNVPVDNASYLERSFQFEAAWPNLQNPGPGDKYSYALGNYCNTLELDLPLTDKSKVTFGFTGTDTANPTVTRKTGASTAYVPGQATAFGTTSDIARLRVTKVDETGLTTCFKSVKLTLNNNVSPEKCLGTLGASFLNVGTFEVNLEAEVLFTESTVIDAIRNNDTVTMDFLLKNADGGIMVDLPSMTLGDGSFNLPVNESVIVNLSGQAFADAVLNTSIGASFFPVLP